MPSSRAAEGLMWFTSGPAKRLFGFVLLGHLRPPPEDDYAGNTTTTVPSN